MHTELARRPRCLPRLETTWSLCVPSALGGVPTERGPAGFGGGPRSQRLGHRGSAWPVWSVSRAGSRVIFSNFLMRSVLPMGRVCYPVSAAGVLFAVGSPLSRGFRLLCSVGSLFSVFIIFLFFFKFLRLFFSQCSAFSQLKIPGNCLPISSSIFWRQHFARRLRC